MKRKYKTPDSMRERLDEELVLVVASWRLRAALDVDGRPLPKRIHEWADHIISDYLDDLDKEAQDDGYHPDTL